jgi:hypothetical protein
MGVMLSLLAKFHTAKPQKKNPLLSAQTVLDAHGQEANVCSLLSWPWYPRTP